MFGWSSPIRVITRIGELQPNMTYSFLRRRRLGNFQGPLLSNRTVLAEPTQLGLRQTGKGVKGMSKNQWVVPRDGGWAVLGEGNSRDTSHHETQAEAIAAGTQIARNNGGELFIQDRHGQIRERNSFGHDPYPPKG